MTKMLTAADRLAARFIPKDATCILEHTNGSACYTYESNGKPCAVAFWGTAAKSLWRHSFRSESERNRTIWEFKESVEAHVTRRRQEADPITLKVGDIVNTSWGYDQTNVEFYVVTRVSKARVWVRRIKADSEAIGYMQERTWPAMPIEPVGDETMHHARGGYVLINGHGAHLTTGDTYSSSYA